MREVKRQGLKYEMGMRSFGGTYLSPGSLKGTTPKLCFPHSYLPITCLWDTIFYQKHTRSLSHFHFGGRARHFLGTRQVSF